jgi:hypothetical protein
VAVAGVACAFLANAAAAWACVTGPTMFLTPSTAAPGQAVTLEGFNWNGGTPIVVHWNALNGPVLGSFMPVDGRFDGSPDRLTGSVKIPADAKPGANILIATQTGDNGKLSNVPVRSLVQVEAPGGLPLVANQLTPVASGRALGLARVHSSVSAVGLVLVGLGGAGVALFVAGLAIFLSSRRPREAASVVR